MKLVVIDLLKLAHISHLPSCHVVAWTGVSNIVDGSPFRKTPIWDNPRSWLSYNEAGIPKDAARKGKRASDLILIGTETSHPIISMMMYPDMTYEQWYHMPYQIEILDYIPYHKEGMRLFLGEHDWPLGGMDKALYDEHIGIRSSWSLMAYETSAFIARKAKHTVKSFYSI